MVKTMFWLPLGCCICVTGQIWFQVKFFNTVNRLGSGRGDPDPECPLLFYENPASRNFLAWSLSRIPFLFPKQNNKKANKHARHTDKSRNPGSCKIPFPIKISLVFPNPAPYFGHIPDPENTLPDPELKVKFKRNL